MQTLFKRTYDARFFLVSIPAFLPAMLLISQDAGAMPSFPGKQAKPAVHAIRNPSGLT